MEKKEAENIKLSSSSLEFIQEPCTTVRFDISASAYILIHQAAKKYFDEIEIERDREQARR